MLQLLALKLERSYVQALGTEKYTHVTQRSHRGKQRLLYESLRGTRGVLNTEPEERHHLSVVLSLRNSQELHLPHSRLSEAASPGSPHFPEHLGAPAGGTGNVLPGKGPASQRASLFLSKSHRASVHSRKSSACKTPHVHSSEFRMK